jgi:hypothetical protein
MKTPMSRAATLPSPASDLRLNGRVRAGRGARPLPARAVPALALVAAVVGAALLVAAQFNPYLGDYGDDAEFLILGQGLARGQGYAWVNSPPPDGWAGPPEAAPRPAHNRYPPGYPALLAAALLVTGTTGDVLAAIVPAKVVTAATLFLALPLVWAIARRRLPAPWAAGAVALFALNPFVIRFATQVMSDVPFILAALAALAWADHLAEVGDRESGVGSGRSQDDRPSGARSRAARVRAAAGRGGSPHPNPLPPGVGTFRPSLLGWAGLGALLALAAYVRSVGLVLAAATLAWAVWHGRRSGLGWRPALVAGATFVVLMLPWWVRDATLAGGWRYIEELLAAQYLDPGGGSANPGDLVARAAGNALFVLGKPGAFGFAGFVVALLAGAVVAVGYWRCLRNPGGAAEWAAVLLVLAVLIWPIRTGRYLLPVLPLACVYAVAGLRAVAALGSDVGARAPDGSVGRRDRRLPVAFAAAGVLAAAVFEAGYGAREAAGNLRAAAAAGAGGAAGYYQTRPEWAHYLEAARWLDQNAGADDVALARRHFALYVYSGRTTDKYRYDVSDDELAYLTSGSARKFVVEDTFGYLRGDFAPLPSAVRARGGDLVLRFATAEPAVRVWELVRPPGAVGTGR